MKNIIILRLGAPSCSQTEAEEYPLSLHLTGTLKLHTSAGVFLLLLFMTKNVGHFAEMEGSDDTRLQSATALPVEK